MDAHDCSFTLCLFNTSFKENEIPFKVDFQCSKCGRVKRFELVQKKDMTYHQFCVDSNEKALGTK
jgi:hypothetical protein